MRVSRIGLHTAALMGAVACGGTDIEPATARAAVYRADVIALYNAVSDEIREQYPHLVEYPGERAIRTAWHQLPFAESHRGREENIRPASEPGTRPGPEPAASSLQPKDMSARQRANWDLRKRREHRLRSTTQTVRNFVRFEVRLEPVGSDGSEVLGRWRVVISGEASVWDNTVAPAPLKGAETPYWLEARREKLEVAIYSRLRAIATAEDRRE